MKKSLLASFAVVLWGCLWAAVAQAHFQVLIPSADVVSAASDRTIRLEILFTHPMEQGPVMEMAAPKQFGFLRGGKRIDLLQQLQVRKIAGKTAYGCVVKASAPGDYVFFLEPGPYWEPGEKKWIVHYTKVVVDVFGAEEGWDAMVGFPVEIEPLVRPFGLWTGNTFRGIVKRDGRPVPFAQVEVEYNNRGGRVKAPNDAFLTQVLKADANGVFCYSIPKAGWWGFAALVAGAEKLKGPDGTPADVELGGLMWIQAVDIESKP